MTKTIHIILLRGLGRESGHWGDFPKKLEMAINQNFAAKIHTIDLLGTGQFYHQRASKTLASLTEHAMLESKKIMAETIQNSGPTYLIGISMGAMVALDWAQKDSNIKGVVLINSSLGQQPLTWRLRLAVWPQALIALIAPTAWREKLMLNIVSNTAKKNPATLQQWLDIQKIHPVTWVNIIAMLIAAARFKPAQSCTCQGLILASEQDRLVSIKCSQAIAKQFNWPIIKHPNAGHDLPLDDGEWVTLKIDEWVVRITGEI